MSEWIYPMAVIALTFGLCIPALTLIVMSALRWRRQRSQRWSELGGGFTLMCVAAPSAVPLLALFTTATQALLLGEPPVSAAGAVCVLDHMQVGGCIDSIILAAGLVVIFAAASSRHLWSAHRAPTGIRLADGNPVNARLHRLTSGVAGLSRLRVSARENAAFPAATHGLLRPHVVLDPCFVASADDEALVAALLHEAEHVRRFDPLRMVFVDVCLTLNPLGRPLRREFDRWRQAREADCDERAVRDGGAPLALASALVQAARFRCAGSACGVHLTGPEGDGLRLRLTHLMVGHQPASTGALPSPASRTARPWPWLLATCVLAGAVPVVVDTGLMAHVHRISEVLWLSLFVT